MGKEKALEFKANLGILAAESYVQYLKDVPVKKRTEVGRRHSLLRACQEATGLLEPKIHREALAKAVKELPVGPDKPDWFDFETLPPTDAQKPAVAGQATGSTQEELKPRVLSFDPATQLPTTQQDSKRAKDTSLGSFPLPLNEWRCSSAAKELGEEPALAAAVLLCLWARHRAAVAEAKRKPGEPKAACKKRSWQKTVSVQRSAMLPEKQRIIYEDWAQKKG